ncbi:MAG: ferrous iron transport protein B [Pirellulaceae bacterium]
MTSKRTGGIFTVAVLGNPNTGKSSLFNALTGSTQRTGNYPGVTVEHRTGRISIDDSVYILTDLPGTYSLTPRSPDEMVAVQFLLGAEFSDRPPDVLLCVVDASNLKRNLFLVSQLLDLGLPVVVALNMTDVAERRGLDIDIAKLSGILGAEVIPVQANRSLGLPELKRALQRATTVARPAGHNPFPASISVSVNRLKEICPDSCQLKQFVVTRMLFDGDGLVTSRLAKLVDARFLENLPREKRQILEGSEITIGEHESQARYAWISDVFDQCVKQMKPQRRSWSSRFDDLLTHPVWGLLVAIVVMTVLFQLVFRLADPASAAIDWGKSVLGGAIESIVPAGQLQSLWRDGLLEGVGGVLVFLPQIMFLFLALGFLEDSGYLARASFLMDKYLSRVGLSGLTLIPLLSSFACAIPGVMATRVIRDPRERLITILIAPLMSCSARLPVYVLLISAFVPDRQYLGGVLGLRGVTMLLMYSIGIVTAIIVAWVIRRLVMRESSSEFLMELPNYKFPQWANIWRRVWEGGWAFVRDAGTLIVCVTVLVWAAAYYPRAESDASAEIRERKQAVETQLEEVSNKSAETTDEQERENFRETSERLAEDVRFLENEYNAEMLSNSFLARAGRWIEPVVRPLGWDWRIGSAVIAAFPAREVIVSTLGVIFGLGGEQDESSGSLRAALATATWPDSGKPLFTLPVALGLMVFFALCAQCVSTLAVIKRETNSWKWPTVTFVYMTALAYLGAFVTYQVGTWISGAG